MDLDGWIWMDGSGWIWLDGSGWQWRGGPKGDTIAILQSHGGKWREGKALHCPTALYACSLAQDLEWEGEALREGDPFSNRGEASAAARTKAVKAATTEWF